MGLSASLYMGPNAFSAFIHSVDLYGGVALFTALSIYDAYLARKMYLENTPDHLQCATSCFLDFINLLIQIMQIMTKAKKE